MATIVPYQQRTSSVVGAPDTRRGTLRVDSSNPLAGVAQGIEKYAEDRRINVVRQEKGEVQRRLAAMEAEGALELDRRNKNEPLNSKTFADDFNTWYAQNAADFSDLTQPEAIELARTGASLQGSSFLQRSGIAQSARAGKYAVETYKATLNDLNITVANDPGQFDRIHASALAVLADPTGPYSGMDKLARQGLTEITNTELAKSAINGVIYQQGAPNRAIEMLRSDKFADLLSSDDQTALLSAARTHSNNQRSEYRAQVAAARAADKDARDRRARDLTNQTLRATDGEGDYPSPTNIANADLSPSEARAAHNFSVSARVNPPVSPAEDSYNASRILSLINRPHGDPGSIKGKKADAYILDAFVKGQISLGSVKYLRKEAESVNSTEGQAWAAALTDFGKGYKGLVSKSTLGKVDPWGDSRWWNFTVYVNEQKQKLIDEGKDPHLLLNPNSEYFVGQEHILAPYRKSEVEVQRERRRQRLEDAKNERARRREAAAAAAEATGESTSDDPSSGITIFGYELPSIFGDSDAATTGDSLSTEPKTPIGERFKQLNQGSDK